MLRPCAKSPLHACAETTLLRPCAKRVAVVSKALLRRIRSVAPRRVGSSFGAHTSTMTLEPAA